MSVVIQRSPWRLGRWLGVVAALVGAVLVLLAYLGWEPGPSGAGTPLSAPAGWPPGASGPADGINPPPALRTGLEGLPASLTGTEVDGQARVDATGRLVPDRRLRDLFDYFLSLLGEESLAQIQARVAAYLATQLPAGAQREALDLFRRYVAYGEARGAMGASDSPDARANLSAEAVAARLAQLEALQQQHFSAAERVALFGDDQLEDRYTVARLALWQDDRLSATEKARQLQVLKDGLPADVRARLTAADAVADLRAVTEAWERDGAAPEVLREARLSLVGEAATHRLEALDAQRAQWRQRVTAYMEARQAVAADVSLSAAQREAALARLREEGFTAQEQLRLDAAVQGAAMR